MKAVLLTETGGPDKIQYTDVDQPVPGVDEVVVKLKSASLNRRDVLITYGMYPGMQLPSILGADGAGIVFAVGENVESLNEGDEVLINPGINWGSDIRYSAPDFHILGMPSNGTWAEYVKVTAENVYRKPSYLTWPEAAAVPLAALTAYRALITRGELEEGNTVFIPNIGSGVALFALQIASALGARAFVSSSCDKKIERAKGVGAAGGMNDQADSWVKDLKQQMPGADLVIDGIGGPAFQNLVQLAKPGGKIITFGAADGPVPEFILPRVFLKHLDIRGTTVGSPQEFANMLQMFEHYKIRPVLDRHFLLEETAAALKYMENGHSFGKIVIDIS